MWSVVGIKQIYILLDDLLCIWSVLIGSKYGFTTPGNHERLISSHFHALQKDQGTLLLEMIFNSDKFTEDKWLRVVPIMWAHDQTILTWSSGPDRRTDAMKSAEVCNRLYLYFICIYIHIYIWKNDNVAFLGLYNLAEWQFDHIYYLYQHDVNIVSVPESELTAANYKWVPLHTRGGGY